MTMHKWQLGGTYLACNNLVLPWYDLQGGGLTQSCDLFVLVLWPADHDYIYYDIVDILICKV